MSDDDVMDLVRHLNRTEVCGGCKREVTPDGADGTRSETDA